MTSLIAEKPIEKPDTNWRFLVVPMLFFFVFYWLIEASIPFEQGWQVLADTLTHYDSDNFQHIIVKVTYFPRLSMALLVGFAMGIAGCIMQAILRNPIASPTTLGIASGAELGLILGVLFIPESLNLPPTITAFLGGCLAAAIVLMLSKRSGYAPIQMVLAGMIVTLLFGSINVVLELLFEYHLSNVFVWGTGLLNQNGWDSFYRLLPVVVVPSAILLLLYKSLATVQLGDEIATSIGVNIKLLRLICLCLGILITAGVVSEVGLIGFIGIIAPAIARLIGIKKALWQMVASALIGAMLLLTADLLVQIIAGLDGEDLPTGAMTAFVGAPLLLLLLVQHRWQSDHKANYKQVYPYRHRRFRPLLLTLSIVLIGIIFASLSFGQSSTGWQFAFAESTFHFRAPRVFAALFAGIGLAFAGTLLQRITKNPMASPEILGISSGIAFAIILGAITGSVVTKEIKLFYGILGAFIVITVLWLIGRRTNFVAAQLLLVGISISAALGAATKIALASGANNVGSLITWFSGSMYLVSYGDLMALSITTAIMVSIISIYHQQLDIIFLGDGTATNLGINILVSKGAILFSVGILTTVCMIVIGPLSFVGLIAPHMARSFSQYTAAKQLVIAAMLGAIILISADWLGRNIWFPMQFPAGLLASVLGGTYFLYMLKRH